MISYSLPELQDQLESALEQLEAQSVLQRIWDHDHTVWSPDPNEITNRLGWLDIPVLMAQSLAKPLALSDSLRGEGIEKVVLLGMGGSSLAPDVFRRTFGSVDGYPELEVIDTTHPDTIQSLTESLNWNKTVFIVATKSGSTVETLSLFRYFYDWVLRSVGAESAGEHFIAITDPESQLVELANQYKFREVFLNDPNIGGRYSALSYFGLVPAALIGIDIEHMFEHALASRESSLPTVDSTDNDAAVLGTILGVCANVGRDKLTLLSSEAIGAFGDWVEQLIAESTGKDGKGILPVVGEPISDIEAYGDDRLFVYMRYGDDDSYVQTLQALADAGHPAVTISVEELPEIGALFFLWEMATAIAGYFLGINPFDQPNVESAKLRAKEMVAAFQDQGELPSDEPAFDSEDVALFLGDTSGRAAEEVADGGSLSEVIEAFLETPDQDAYVSIQAYLDPSQELTAALRAFQSSIRDATSLATTLGYGPRYLHSTGQLHKGDAGKGLFIQLTEDKQAHVEIPGEPGSDTSNISFNTLIDAQAIGDRKALSDQGRSVLRIHFKANVIDLLNEINREIS